MSAGQASSSQAAPVPPETITLSSVPGFIVLDLPGAGLSAGGTRLAPDVTPAEVALLARAMTYKFAVLGAQVGGAKAGARAAPADGPARAALMAAYCTEILPLVAAGRFLTGPDMGTFEEDFAPLRARNAAPGAMTSTVNGVPFEDLLTGFGVTVAAETALRSGPAGRPAGWDGCSVAIEGFGKVGGGVATEVTRRGGRVVAVSTLAGCLSDPAGLDVSRLLALRAGHGDHCVTAYGSPAGPPGPPGQLFTVPADVLVPGTRPGAITAAAARALPATVRVIAPAANAPYTRAGAEELHRRGVLALPDFVSNAGAVLGYRSPSGSTPEQVLAGTEARIAGLTGEALGHPDGPLAGACAMAEAFLRGWWGEPPGPPFAPGD
jgi:glutamate dehydrogenase/leucine dehydrogenase